MWPIQCVRVQAKWYTCDYVWKKRQSFIRSAYGFCYFELDRKCSLELLQWKFSLDFETVNHTNNTIILHHTKFQSLTNLLLRAILFSLVCLFISWKDFYWIQPNDRLACVSIKTIHSLCTKHWQQQQNRAQNEPKQFKSWLKDARFTLKKRCYSFIVKCVTFKVIVSDGFEWCSFKYVPHQLCSSRNDTGISFDIHLYVMMRAQVRRKDVTFECETKTTQYTLHMWGRWTIYSFPFLLRIHFMQNTTKTKTKQKHSHTASLHDYSDEKAQRLRWSWRRRWQRKQQRLPHKK